MRWILSAALLAALSLAAPAAHADAEAHDRQVISLPAEARKAERFMTHATGSLVVETDGSVSDVKLAMASSTREIYRQAIARWVFEPMRVGGEPVRAKARFTLLASGTAIPGSDDMRLGIDQVWFHESSSLEGEEEYRAERSRLAPPRYPADAAIAGFGGTVDVLVKLDAEGRVVDAGVAGVALSRRAVRSERQAESMARKLADASVRAARGWVLVDPEVLEIGSAIIPVTFHPPQEPIDGWKPQIPLEVTPLPWMLTVQAQAVALTPGGEPTSSRFKLVDEVAGTAVN